MTGEEIKAQALRFIEEGWNGWGLGVFEQIVSDDFLLHLANHSREVLGIAGAREVVTEWRTAFPDLSLSVDDLIAENDKVVARFTLHVQTGVAALSKILILRIAQGKIVEAWEDYEPLDVLRPYARGP